MVSRTRILTITLVTLVFAVRSLHSQTANRTVVIDGRLDDSLWRTLPAEKLTPSERGIDAELGGELRIATAGRFLYIGASLPEPTGRITARLIGRNPSWEDEDLLRVVAGADISSTDRIIHINPFGAYSVEKGIYVQSFVLDVFPYSFERPTTQVMYKNMDKYLVAAAIGEREWIVEAAIPLNEMSITSADRVPVRVQRIRAPRPGSPPQRWHWPERGPTGQPVAIASDWNEASPVLRAAPLGNTDPPIEVAHIRALPAPELGWDDPPWRDVPKWDLLREEPLPRRPRFPTEVKLLHDGTTLAVLAHCIEPDSPSAAIKDNDGPVSQDDNFQVHLATSGSSYTQFIVNPLGYLFDTTSFFGGQRLSRARDWSSGTRVTARREAGHWLARLDIPLDPVANALGEEDTRVDWRVLFHRVRQTRPDEPVERSSFPVIHSDTTIATPRYRKLVLSAATAQPASNNSLSAQSSGLASLDGRVLSPAQRREARLPGMVQRHISARVQKITAEVDRQWQNVKSRADWERLAAPRIKALRASFGEFPKREPLRTRVTKQYIGEGYRRQDLVYQSQPGVWVTANLYLSAEPPARMPGMLIIHSHHRPRTQAELQDMGILWARAGCAVLVMDQMGHGERSQHYPWNREGYHGRYILGMQLYLAGESLLKWMVWDIMRGVDLLLERSDVNPNQIIILGAVAAGGEPSAVTAALDSRVSAVAPFNFGRTTPSGGDWESTRCIRRSIIDQFYPWIIVGSVAPRRVIYSVEMGWETYKHDSLDRYKKIFDLYGSPGDVGEAHGFGTFPGPGECANIGPTQRQTLYPELNRWFSIPIPAREPDDRRPDAELASLTPTLAREIDMRPIHQLALDAANVKLKAARAAISSVPPAERLNKLRTAIAAKLGDIEPNSNPAFTSHWNREVASARVEGITLEVESGITVPLLLLRPAAGSSTPLPIVVAVSQHGKDRFLSDRSAELEALLKAGNAVCLPDVRGTGETAMDTRRGRSSQEQTLASVEFMLGSTLLAGRLKDLRTVIAYVATRPDLDARRIAVWGDSFVPANPQRITLDELPGWQIGPDIKYQAEPLGALLALLSALYEDRLRAIAARNGLAGYSAILEDTFAYVPNDIIVPGILEVADLADIAAALAPRSLLLDGTVDGRNRQLDVKDLEVRYAATRKAYGASSAQFTIRAAGSPLAPWLAGHLR
jgi:cephalosporin-C deacetylase-like acetyl esterase